MVDETSVNFLSYSIFFNSNNKFNRNKVKESWIKKHYSIEHSNIQRFCQDKKIHTDIFSQKIYHYIFKIDQIPTCIKCNSRNQRYEGFNIGYNKFCSKGCASSNSFKEGYKNRKKNTFEKHGVYHTTQLESVREKMKISNLEKYGVEYAAQNSNVLNKMKNTNKRKYGVEFPIQNRDIRNKVIEKTNFDEVKFQINKTSYERYGVKWPIQSDEVKKKIKESFIKSISLRLEEIYDNNFDVKFIKYENGISLFRCLKCNQEFEISSSLLYQRHIKHGITICVHCNKLNDKTSNGHVEILDFLRSLDILCDVNVRNIISPYEIDIYLPDYKIGIEFNGVYWHSEIIKDKNYHLNKRKECLSKGIDLIQIWEDDWKIKKDIIKSILLSRIGKSPIVKWARKLQIRRIYNEKLIKEFLLRNHLQGWSLSSIKYGLFDGEELISIGSFSKSRINVNNKEWELVRFCNKLNYTVLGSFSKLMNRFILDHNPRLVISYSDNDIFNGKSYENYKMIKSNESLNYWWCDGRVRHNRWKFRKNVLVNQGNDKSLSGTQIMINNGYFRCWGSGTTKWELIRNI